MTKVNKAVGDSFKRSKRKALLSGKLVRRECSVCFEPLTAPSDAATVRCDIHVLDLVRISGTPDG